MSKLIPPPPPTVPLGKVKANGDVIISQDWALYLTFGLLQRLGGYNGPDIDEIAGSGFPFIDGYPESDEGDVIVIPGQQGIQGVPGAIGWLMTEEQQSAPDLLMPPGGERVHGRYTPTLTSVANVSASTAYECAWVKYGSAVFVSGKVDVDPTAAALVQLGISLPTASNLASDSQCAGTAAAPQVAGQSAAIVGDATNNRAELQFTAVDLSNRSMYFTFMYWIFV